MIDQDILRAQELLDKADQIEGCNCTYDCYHMDCGYECPESCMVRFLVEFYRRQADRLLNCGS